MDPRPRPLVLGDPPERKASKTRRLVAIASGGRPAWTSRDYASLAREGFARNPVAYRCIRMIAEAAASVPLVVFADGARAPDHPLQALIDRPNPEQSAPDLMEGFFGAVQTAGNGYLEAAGDSGDAADPPTELYALRPDRMTAVPGPQGWADAYDYQCGAAKVRLRRGADGFMPVLHLKLYNPTDDYYGFSPLEAAAVAIDMHNAASAWNKALLDNSARPSGALVYSNRDAADRITDDQFDRLKAELESTYTGSIAAGRPMLLEGGLDWKPMSLTPADMDYIEGKHAAPRDRPGVRRAAADPRRARRQHLRQLSRGQLRLLAPDGRAPGGAGGAGDHRLARAQIPWRGAEARPRPRAGLVRRAGCAVGAPAGRDLPHRRRAAAHGRPRRRPLGGVR